MRKLCSLHRSAWHVFAAAMFLSTVAALSLLMTPSPAYAQSAPPASSSFAGKRLAIRIVQNCPSDPDPLGLVSDNLYSDCDQDELDQLRGWLTSEITAKNIFAGVVDADADLTLTVTLTKDQEIGSDTIFGDLANEDQYEAQADYRLTDAAGAVLLGGTVDSRAKDYADSDIENVHRDLVAKVAEALVSGAPIATSAPAGAIAPGGGAPVIQAATPAPPLRFGITVGDLAPSVAADLGHPGLTGAFVVNYVLGSPADKAGIRLGDVIYEFDGKPVASAGNLVAAIAAEPVGKAVSVKLLRGKQDIGVVVQL
jgi:PDZ domain